MSKDLDDKKRINRLLERACKGTSVTSKELLRELVTSGNMNLYEIGLNLDDLKSIVADLAESKEISELTSKTSKAKTKFEIGIPG